MKKGKILSLLLAGATMAGCAPMSMTPSINLAPAQPNFTRLEKALMEYQQSEDFMLMHDKSDHFLAQIEERHLTPEGLLAYNIDLRKSEPGKPFVHSAGDCALHTSLYLAAESYRYASTKDPKALEHVKRTLEALRKLKEVTGVKGLFARYYGLEEYTRESEFEGKFVYEGVGKFKGYKWKGDVSNDQLAGIYFAYAVTYDLVNDESVRQMIREDVAEITNHMIENRMRFRDANGRFTRFTNMSPTGAVDISRMLGLSFLKTAYHITGKENYKDKYHELIDVHHYDQRIKVLKPALITKKLDIENDFNDNVIFIGLHSLLQYEDDKKLLGAYRKATDLVWVNFVRGEGNSFFNLIYNANMPKSDYLEESWKEALASLVLMPTDKRAILVENSKRDDICKRMVTVKTGNPELKACEPLLISERPRDDFAWQRDPYELDGGDKKPRKEYTGVDFLLPYWMARYHNFVGENQ